MEVRVLGPIEVWRGGTQLRLARRQHGLILGILALDVDHSVSTETLIDLIWAGCPPKQARAVLQSRISELRTTLARSAGDQGGQLLRCRGGYRLSLQPNLVDAHRFRRLLAQARELKTDDQVRDTLRDALSLWRGPVLGGRLPEVSHAVIGRDLESARLTAMEELYEVEVRMGHHRAHADEMLKNSIANPDRERLTALTMLALHRSGRTAEALGLYDRCRRWLADEFGVDPGTEMQDLHVTILRADPQLAGQDLGAGPHRDTSAVAPPDSPKPARDSPASTGTPPIGSSQPFQLPGDVPNFVGREHLIERIRSLLDPSVTDDTAVPGVILSGLPGVGKTALAIHVAYRTQATFPDGQLYVDMRGYSHGGPVTAAGALTRFLRALGIASEDIPADVDEQSTLFRSLLNSRQILVLLDNVISADQVRPLLPGRPGSVVLVTSRDTLGGLSAINSMLQMPVDPVTPAEAMTLLHTLIGDLVTDEPEAAGELAALCGNLPLALRIAAANLAASPEQAVASYIAEVRSEDRVGALAIDGDDDATVEVAFDLSYRTLPPAIARMFRLLSLVPGPDFDRWAAANVADVDPLVAGRMLTRLASANLIQRKLNRYHFHDLIREYAHRKGLAEDGGEAARSVRRLFDFYLHATDEAVHLLHPDLPRLGLPTSPATPTRPSLHEPSLAIRWLDAEIANLETMVCGTAPGSNTLPVWLLADAMVGYLDQQRLDTSLYAVCSTARDLAARHGDRRAEAAMCRALGRLYYLQTRYELAEELYLHAADTFRETGDLVGEVSALNGLGGIAGSSSDYAKANEYLHRALRASRAAGDREGQAETLTNLGTSLVLIGQAEAGVMHLRSACAIAAELNFGHVSVRAESAIALHDLYCGALDDAARRFDGVLKTCRRVDYSKIEAQTLRNLAEVELESGRPGDAHRLAERALELADKIDAFWNVMGAHITLGQAALALGDVATAAKHFSHAYDLRASRVRFWYPFAMLGLAACRRLAGDAAPLAVALADEAVTDPRPRVRGQAHLELARVHLSLGDGAKGLVHSREACETARSSGYRLDLARALRLAADLHELMGDSQAAADHRARAEDAFATSLTGGVSPKVPPT